MTHTRKCHSCGNVAEHTDSVSPHVECSVCGSPDTRRTKALWFGSSCYIPPEVAVCPECGGKLAAQSTQWETESGRPVAHGIEIECLKDSDGFGEIANGIGHRWHQSTWQPVLDVIGKWCNARIDYGR